MKELLEWGQASQYNTWDKILLKDKFLESSKNEKTAYQNIANTIKAVLKGHLQPQVTILKIEIEYHNVSKAFQKQ